MKVAIFILTHGRPDKQLTYNWLIEHNCTIPIYLIVDNQDATVPKYQELFGNKVIVFDKPKYIEMTDTVMNDGNVKSVVYARNAAFDIAQDLGLDYFAALDDDIHLFSHRYVKDDKLCTYNFESADDLFNAVFQFAYDTDADALSLTNRANYYGGKSSPNITKGLLLDNLNSAWVLKSTLGVRYKSYILEDLIFSLLYAMQGFRVFRLGTVCFTANEIGKSNANEGNNEIYQKFGKVGAKPIIITCPTRTLRFAKNRGATNPFGPYATRIEPDCISPKVVSYKYKKPVESTSNM